MTPSTDPPPGERDMSLETGGIEAAAVAPGAGAPVEEVGPAAAERAGSATPVAEAGPPAPAVLPASLLGLKRAKVEATLGKLRPGTDDWLIGGDYELRFRDTKCVGLRGHVPQDMDCMNVAQWLGYGPTAFPLRRADSCEWPGLSPKHRLAEGVAGRYEPATRVFELWTR